MNYARRLWIILSVGFGPYTLHVSNKQVAGSQQLTVLMFLSLFVNWSLKQVFLYHWWWLDSHTSPSKAINPWSSWNTNYLPWSVKNTMVPIVVRQKRTRAFNVFSISSVAIWGKGNLLRRQWEDGEKFWRVFFFFFFFCIFRSFRDSWHWIFQLCSILFHTCGLPIPGSIFIIAPAVSLWWLSLR